MNNKQSLLKGFEIGLKSKDVISGQLELAKEMSLVEENIDRTCNNCIHGKDNCNYSSENNGTQPIYTGKNIGFNYVIENCSGFKQK